MIGLLHNRRAARHLDEQAARQGAHLPAEPVSAATRQLASSWPLLDAALRRHWHTFMPGRRDGAWSAGKDIEVGHGDTKAVVSVRVTEPADKLAQAGWQVTSSASQGAITDLSRDAALACADALIHALAAESQPAEVTG
jgi:hypothetical protein